MRSLLDDFALAMAPAIFSSVRGDIAPDRLAASAYKYAAALARVSTEQRFAAPTVSILPPTDPAERAEARRHVLDVLKALDDTEPHLQRAMCFDCVVKHGAVAPAEKRGPCPDDCGCHRQES